MGRFNDALTAMRGKMLLLTPSPAPSLRACYVYPKLPVPEINNLPTAMIQAVINRENPIDTQTVGEARQRWVMWVDVLLAHAPLSTEDLIAEASQLYEPWIDAMDNLIATNNTLDGTVTYLGTFQPGGHMFVPIAAEIIWFGQWYWGLRFQIPVIQTWQRAKITP